MGKEELVAFLNEIADLLDIQGVRFKPEAYRRAARGVEGLSEDLEEMREAGRLTEIPGVGEGVARRIEEYLDKGRISLLEELREAIPPGLAEVMRIPGVGPKTAELLHRTLGIATVDDLRKALEDGRVTRIKGMGPKKVENMLRGIALLAETKGRTLLGLAHPIALRAVTHLKSLDFVQRVDIAGSLRRMKETIGDIDILLAATDRDAAIEAFVTMPGVADVVAQGPTKATVRLVEGLQADLRVVDADGYGAALLYFTGSKDHNVHLRTLAQRQGLKINEYGLFRGEERIAGLTEEEMYKGLGMTYIEPELRENSGEVEAALEGRLPPRLLKEEDIRGDLHVHTDETDGHDSLGAMVAAARARGYEYVGISDHSQSLAFINGLTPERLLAQRDRIHQLNQQVKGIHVLHGSEVDIREDGSLDYPDEVLKELDYVIASVHSKFNMEEGEMTKRVLRALENEHVTILGHPTCRLIGSREPIQIDMERVMASAAEGGVALEVNGYYNRLDLSGNLARMAKARGVRLAVNTDSHATGHLDMMRFGVGTARRGWLEPQDVLNTLPYDVLRRLLA